MCPDMFLKNNQIKNFPISFFSVVMGLSGLTISLQKAISIFGLSPIIPLIFLYLSVAIFVILSLIYLLKILLSYHEFVTEFNHPVKINFFPTFSISLILLSIAFLSFNFVEIYRYFWYIGTVINFIFTLIIINTWMHRDWFNINHMNPSWFIPAVGNILVPVSGVSHFNQELSWFFFSFGMFFWIILLAIFLYRIFFHEALIEKLTPTLFIMIAPPAIGFISYFKLSGVINDFSRILYYFAIFLTILMFTQIRIHSQIKYYLSWWAYSFPLAAVSIASALMYYETKILIYQYLFVILLLILIYIIAMLFYKTWLEIINKKICIEEN